MSRFLPLALSRLSTRVARARSFSAKTRPGRPCGGGRGIINDWMQRRVLTRSSGSYCLEIIAKLKPGKVLKSYLA
jgi:hypothetical protein